MRVMVPTIEEEVEQQEQQQQEHKDRLLAGAETSSETRSNGGTSSNSSLLFANYQLSSKQRNSQSSSSSSSSYISSLVSKSTILLHSLKQSYASLTTNQGAMQSSTGTGQQQSSSLGSPSRTRRDLVERQLSASSFFGASGDSSGGARNGISAINTPINQSPARKPPMRPPLPPPPPKEVVVASAQRQATAGQPQPSNTHQMQPLSITRSIEVGAMAGQQNKSQSSRRHAIQEQSLERDAALSLKVHKDHKHKHKRTSSIKSALRHAHLRPLRADKSDRGGDSSASCELANSMPYELFEPPVTQRTFQRSRRRDAMLSDPKRQLSADTIGLRQLTDEYLHNAGVKPMSSSGQCSLVALSAQSNSTNPSAVSTSAVAGNSAATSLGPLPTGSLPVSSGIPAAAAGQQPQYCIETQLYQASRRTLFNSTNNESGSEDSLSHVTILPGNLPWQSDVSIQCELLQAPPMFEPYETTGDILNTIARPFRGSMMALDGINNESSLETSSNQLSATLKRGLSAISQHHLSPAAANPTAALQVVGNLKKSLSNTLDMSLVANVGSSALHLHSQDSLPAYSSFQNEPDWTSMNNDEQTSRLPPDQMSSDSASSGLIGQLASKLGRQSSKKFVVSKKGLQRALSFDCRGYKRLDGTAGAGRDASGQQNRAQGSSNKNLLSAKNRPHNRSTLGLNSDQSPRPYLPQSASQVDFQVPLLPYHKMQEAIVSQRLLVEPPAKQAKEPAPSAPVVHDVDQLICSTHVNGDLSPPVEPQRNFAPQETGRSNSDSMQGTEQSASEGGGASVDSSAGENARRSTAPRLVLDIPTITMPASGADKHSNKKYQKAAEADDDDDGEEVCAAEDASSNVVVCLPSPNVAIDAFNTLSSSPSFCIEPNNRAATKPQSLLSANDVFANSQNLIKRPSTMLATDAMNQVAQALNNSTALNQQQTTLRNRRQAIVPPKMTTDANNSDGETVVAQLVDVGSSGESDDHSTDEHMRAHRRKRSGGEQQQQPKIGENLDRKTSGSQAALPTFHIEPHQNVERGSPDKAAQFEAITAGTNERPDSQLTNIESIVSSGSSTNLSLLGRRDFSVTSPGGLTVTFGSSRGRRRSSIAVIPQMQICPGDLLVYSKQLIDRMNQNDENAEPPQFLTVDDKKGKNIWSSLKLCAQFDNRTLKARNELLCSLEDVLASLQPSTFVDEQLSHYKGMLWNEFLYETESRRSASSEGLAPSESDQNQSQQVCSVTAQESAPAGINNQPKTKLENYNLNTARESLKVSISSGTPTSGTTTTPQHRARDQTSRSISSRFREKPKLKRGQTVDSVFRIPLIPSSPLKHAQQHQQTPTAHLEDHDLLTIEDDERSSIQSEVAARDGSTRESHSSHTRHNRSSSTRSRSGSHKNAQLGGDKTDAQAASNFNNHVDQDSSFETDDAIDLMIRGQRNSNESNKSNMKHFVRQSSLSTLSSTITRTEQKRQRALWDLFQSECTFFFDHLLTLKNVYMEPLKKIQVEGFAMFADPDVLFGNLDELCCGVYDFCKEFLYIIMRTLKTRPEELNATDVLIKLYKKNPKIDHLRGVYHRYTLNYINALTYLESLRRQVEFVEFEKWSSRDVRCKKLQLTDLLVAPVQHIMRVPIILKDIESHTENLRDREEIRAILAVEEASLRELDDKMRWLKNFERLLEIQKNISWPNVLELDPKLFIPDFLKEVLSKQPCERLIVSPRRQIVHEGTLSNLDTGKACDMHVILFDDMLLLTRRKKGLTKKASTVCKSNSSGTTTKDDGSFKYIVYKQPLSLDRFYVHDIQQVDAQSIGMKHLFLLIVLNRFQQISNVHSFSAPNDDIKQTWLFKIKKTAERWKKNFSTSSNEPQQPLAQELQKQPSPQPQQQQQHREYPIQSPNLNDAHESRSSHSRQTVKQINNEKFADLKLNAQGSAKTDYEQGHAIELIVTSASHENSSYSH